jgi:hypothetical protein
LLMFLLAWGRYLERYDQLYWQLGPDFNIDLANGPVLLPSFSLVFVAMITGSFFLIFPFIRGRLTILPALKNLSAGHSQRNPHLRLIRYVLATAMFMLWHTAPQTCQPPALKASVAGLHLPFSAAGKSSLRECKEHYTKITGHPFSISQSACGNDTEAMTIAQPPSVTQED